MNQTNSPFRLYSDQEINKIQDSLAPPGMGIPWYQMLFLRYYIKPFIAAKANPEKSASYFNHISQKIFSEIKDLSDSQLETRVLVPKLRGLEDSSRFWSIAMTLDHIVIVGSKILEVIDSLESGKIPSEVANTAEVKPDSKCDPKKSVAAFSKFVLVDFVKFGPPTSTANLKYKHPWFDEMNSKQWYWLLGVHSKIHLNQIKLIKSIGDLK